MCENKKRAVIVPYTLSVVPRAGDREQRMRPGFNPGELRMKEEQKNV